MKDDADVAWCCVLAGDFYRPLAAFLESLGTHCPGAPCTVFMFAAPPPPLPLLKLAKFVDMTSSLKLSFTPGMHGAPGWAHVAMAAKPIALAQMLDAGHRAVIYADADLWLIDRPESLLRAVLGASIVFTPHAVLPPASPRAVRKDLLLLTAGTYNAGLVGVSEGEVARGFCAWWAERALTLADRPVLKPSDQRWLNLVPHLFRDVLVLDDPGVNVGHWRIESDTDVELSEGCYRLRGHPIALLHMSGFDPAKPSQWSRHDPELVAREGTALRKLADRYAECVTGDVASVVVHQRGESE